MFNLLAFTAAILLAGCNAPVGDAVQITGKDSYKLTVLGDLHFDAPEYHVSEPGSENQRRERLRNLSQWQGKSQELLAAAEKTVGKESEFVIQLGDITQGDCENAEIQGVSFRGIYVILKKIFNNKKIFSLNGNHDARGKNDATEADDRYFVPLLKKELGNNVEMDGTNYAVKYGKDLYIFYDYTKNSSGAFAKKMIENNTDARHIFFLTHLPLFPCSGGNPGWIVKEFEELLPLFAKHGVIVLCAHTHMYGHIVYKNKDGVVPQLTVNSMGINWAPGTKMTQTLKSFDEWKKKIHPRYYTREDAVKLLPNIAKFKNSDFIEYSRYTATPSGFVALEVTDTKVTAQLYTDKTGKPVHTVVLKDNSKKKSDNSMNDLTDYQVTVLGDTHYDDIKYHASKPEKPYQIEEQERNIRMWANGDSDAMLAAASSLTSDSTPFVIQTGDISQGDCDSVEDQQKMISDAFDKISSHFGGKKVFSVIGNHDIRFRSPAKTDISTAEKVFVPAQEKQLGKKSRSGNYTVRHGKDLFIFFGAYSTSDRAAYDFVSSALNQNKDARHVFYITHVPLLAWSYTHPTPGHDKIVPLLLSRNAIILSGHTHRSSLLTLTKGDKKLTQFVVSSIGADWKKDTVWEKSFDNVDKFMQSKKESIRKRDSVIKRMAELKKYKITTADVYSQKSGFAVLKVKGDTVSADLYLDDSRNPVQTFVLKGNNK